MRRSVVVMPGDGIGPQVMPAALATLDAVGFEADYVHADVGWECWRREGQALPERTAALVERHGLALFGAITSKPKAAAEAELAPHLRGRGLRYASPVLELRRRFALETSLRPCVTYPGNPMNFVRRRGGALDEPRIDVTLVTQNTECLYAQVEWSDPPREVREALATHPRMAAFAATPSRDLALSVRILSRDACLRTSRVAFQLARARGHRRVTLSDKWGVMGETANLFLEAAQAVQAEFPDVELERTNVDAQALWLSRRPEDFAVLLSSALLGDILSDGFAGLVGGLGFAPSANLGPRCAVFEPCHGSAPKYADLDPPIVNPIAMILSAAMLLDHVGEAERAARVRAAVAAVVREGRVRSFDMLGLRGGPEVLRHGAASTAQLTGAVIDALRASL